MNPIKFKEANIELTPPPEMGSYKHGTLVGYYDEKSVITCWRPNFLERVKLLFVGKIWLWQLCSINQMPLTGVSTMHPFTIEKGEQAIYPEQEDKEKQG